MAKKNFITNTSAVCLISLSMFLAGCSENTASNAANMNNTNQAVVTNTNTAVMNANAETNALTMNTNKESAMGNGNISAPNANRKPAQNTKAPTPQIGSGGSDLLLFTQLRASLVSEPDLQRDVIIEVKDGSVTLTGKAPSQELKAKAEQLIKTVNGVKTVKNNITVSK